jgi:hypothetical protein
LAGFRPVKSSARNVQLPKYLVRVVQQLGITLRLPKAEQSEAANRNQANENG